MTSRESLIEIYLDWFNNYLSAETYAEHNGLEVEDASVLIRLARSVYNSQHPDN